MTFPKPTNKSVVHESMCRVAAAAENMVTPFIIMVGDQPVYTLIVELKSKNHYRFSSIHPYLGPFHGQCFFM